MSVRVGSIAPAFEAKRLDGEPIVFPRDWSDKKVLVVFWATWCGPCRAEIPHLQDAYEKLHGRGLEIVGVSLDSIPADQLQRFVSDKRMPWTQTVSNSADIARAYGVSAIPAMFLVDGRTGRVLATSDEISGEKLARTIASHLGT